MLEPWSLGLQKNPVGAPLAEACDTGDDDWSVVVVIEHLWLLKHINEILQQQLVVNSDQQVRPRISICHQIKLGFTTITTRPTTSVKLNNYY